MWTIAGGIFLFFLLIIAGCIIVCIPFWIVYGLKCLANEFKRMGIHARRSREAAEYAKMPLMARPGRVWPAPPRPPRGSV
jgi:hypothetical protein